MRTLNWVPLALFLCACAPQTGLMFEVQGPDGTSSITAGVAELRLIMARPSYCGRWVSDTESSALKVDVSNRDLETSPVSILVTPDKTTVVRDYGYPDPAPEAQPVRAVVLAIDASGQLLGAAEFDPVPFVYEEVRSYQQRIVLYGRGAAGPAYVTSDGCVCGPGLPSVGNGTGRGCDALIPPSYDRLIDTAGCELPAGAKLPLNVCDGQLYPGERQNRDLPCFATVDGVCRVARRVCNDTEGLTYDRECVPTSSSPALPSASLCDVYLGCERNTCGDPEPCLVEKAKVRKRLACHLPISPQAVVGAGAPCVSGGWTLPLFPNLTGNACVATMVDGARHPPVVVGWNKEGSDQIQLISNLCPPTLTVSRVDADPAKLPGQVQFTISVGDEIYDVSLSLVVECGAAADSPLNRLNCQEVL